MLFGVVLFYMVKILCYQGNVNVRVGIELLRNDSEDQGLSPVEVPVAHCELEVIESFQIYHVVLVDDVFPDSGVRVWGEGVVLARDEG